MIETKNKKLLYLLIILICMGLMIFVGVMWLQENNKNNATSQNIKKETKIEKNIIEEKNNLTISKTKNEEEINKLIEESEKQENNSKEEKATITSFKELNFKDVDGEGKNYTFTYNNIIFKAQYTKDNWKIIDSYKITNEKDMKIICQALIKIHPIHGKDGVSYRTVEDLVDEWIIHNKVYDILPKNSKWKANVKDVDLDSADQGKTLQELIKDRLKTVDK